MIISEKNHAGLATLNRASLRTRSKIIEVSIDLFNRHGIQHVTTKQIAEAVGISPSNLTYHFRRKSDLMMAILIVLEEHMREALTPPRLGKNVRYRGENLEKVLLTLWSFRFFFNALTFLLPRDRELSTAYFRFQNWAIDTLDLGFQELVRKGDFNPIALPNSPRLLAENVWVQWIGWLHMQQIRSPADHHPKGAALYDCALHFWSLVAPHFSRQDAKYLLPIYRARFLGTKSLADTGKADKS